MKVAIVSSHTPSLFWFRTEMMKEFIIKGHEVIAIGNEPVEKWNDKFSEIGVRYISCNMQRNGTNPIKDIKTLKSLYSILKQEKPNKLFTYQAKPVIYGNIAAKLNGIDEIYSLIAGMGSIFLKDNLVTKLIRSIVVLEYKIALRNCIKVFFQNEDDINTFDKYHLIDRNKVVMIPGSGVNLDKFKPQPLPTEASFECISRLIKDKGVGEYLQAARIVKERYNIAKFYLVGPYDTNPSAIKPDEIEEYVKDGIIEYFGEQEDVRPYLKNCSVYVLPSYREGMPKTILEAMACGKAIITTNAPGCKETVINNQNGFLVPVKNVDEIVDKMIELINKPQLVKQMSQESLKLVKKFDVNRVNSIICSTMKL